LDATPSARATSLGAGIKLLAKAATALNGWAVSRAATREIERLKPEILTLISRHEEQARQTLPDLGVLLVVGIQSGDPKKFAATPGRMLIGVHIAGAGTDFQSVYNAYVSRPQLVAGASKDWIRQDAYVWATRMTMA
jgi:hypothetical protein